MKNLLFILDPAKITSKKDHFPYLAAVRWCWVVIWGEKELIDVCQSSGAVHDLLFRSIPYNPRNCAAILLDIDGFPAGINLYPTENLNLTKK